MVLTGDLHVKDALLNYPKDVSDSSLKAAYHALVHFEADEDLRKFDINYRDEQNEYLEFIAQLFQKGEDLPKNIIKSYDKYYKNFKTPYSKTLKGLIKSLCRFLNV
jgi:hypothetical protein